MRSITSNGMKVNQKAPEIKLPDQDGKIRKLSDWKVKRVLVYFYPKDDTPGCTKEACSIRDNFPKFNKLNCEVIGISVDSVKSHKKFAKKYGLKFILLSDEKKQAVKKYGVWAKKKFLGREYMGTLRTSFLINPQGKVVKVYENVKPDLHVDEVL